MIGVAKEHSRGTDTEIETKSEYWNWTGVLGIRFGIGFEFVIQHHYSTIEYPEPINDTYGNRMHQNRANTGFQGSLAAKSEG